MFPKYLGITVLLVLSFGLFSKAMFAYAAQTPENEQIELGTSIAEQKPVTANIRVPSQVEVGESFIINAKNSFNPRDTKLEYTWYIDGKKLSQNNAEFLHSFDTPGRHELRLEIFNGVTQDETQTHIQSFSVLASLFGSSTFNEKQGAQFELIFEFAQSQGWYIEKYLPAAQNSFESFLYNHTDAIKSKDIILFGELTDSEISELLDFASRQNTHFEDKTILFITQKNQRILGQIVKNLYDIANVSDIYLIEGQDSHMIFNQGQTNFETILQNTSADYLHVSKDMDRFFGINALGYTVSKLVQSGVSTHLLLSILYIPFLALLVAFFKQVIGIRSIGVYVPTFLALSLYSFYPSFAILLLAVLMFLAMLFIRVGRKIRLLYIPRVAMTLGFLSVSLIFFLAISHFLEIQALQMQTIFPLLVFLFIIEKFLILESQEGPHIALFDMAQTLFVAFCGYLMLMGFSGSFSNFLLVYPELSVLAAVANIAVGYYTGLRVAEYIRFRTIFMDEDREE